MKFSTIIIFRIRDFIKSLPIYIEWGVQLKMMRLESMRNGAFNSLNLLHSIFKNKEIKYWLYSGTLLGFIRDGGPISGDTDIDLGFWKEDMTSIEALVSERGFIKIHDFSFEGIVYEQRWEFEGVGIDFFYFSKDNDREYTYQFNRKLFNFYPVKEEHFNNEFSKLVERKFSEYVFQIPIDFERILENTYGEWRVPISIDDGYKPFSAPIHKHLPNKIAKYQTYSKSTHQLNIFSFLVNYILKKIKND